MENDMEANANTNLISCDCCKSLFPVRCEAAGEWKPTSEGMLAVWLCSSCARTVDRFDAADDFDTIHAEHCPECGNSGDGSGDGGDTPTPPTPHTPTGRGRNGMRIA